MPTLSRRTLLALSGVVLLPTRAVIAAEDNSRAPFGLTWGMSADEIKNSGAKLITSEMRSFGVSFMASDLAKVLADTESVLLSFGYKDKLWRIATAGRSIGADPFGGQVLARYQDLSTSLADRYGKGNETDVRDQQVWKAPNEYVTSIKQGRAHRFTTYRSSSVDVELSVRATDTDKAYYFIIFEYRPGSQEFEADKKAHEKEAL